MVKWIKAGRHQFHDAQGMFYCFRVEQHKLAVENGNVENGTGGDLSIASAAESHDEGSDFNVGRNEVSDIPVVAFYEIAEEVHSALWNYSPNRERESQN